MNKPNSQQRRAETVSDLSVTKKYECIKLGIDWHARQFRVVRIIDGAGPEPAQRFTPEGFLKWAKKQLQLATEVHSCYEAGAGGFVLHRQLTKLGVKNVVIAPRRRRDKKVKNDALDAREMAQDLDRYVRGNPKALQLAHVPSPEEEQRRAESRQRLQMRKHRLSLAAQGRSLLLTQGVVQGNNWWHKQSWEKLRKELSEWLVKKLEVFRRLILAVDEEMAALRKSIEAAASGERPKGLGALTMEELQREVCDWKRFGNRKAPGSYTGLVGGLDATGDYACELPITKAGNARLRAILIELAWRWIRYQPESPLVQRWAGVLLATPKAHKRARKRAIVALARQLFVDLWRWQTGRATPEQLGWVMLGHAPPETA